MFQVPFTVGDVLWSVQVEKATVGDRSTLSVVQAQHPEGEVMPGPEWEDHLSQAGQHEAFWAVAVPTLLSLIRGGTEGA